MMDIKTFKKRVAFYGADLSRWPVEEIKPALELVRLSPEAKKVFSEAERLDEALRHYSPVQAVPPLLAEIIVKQSRLVPQQKTRSLRPFSNYLYIPGGGLLIAALLGFMIGFSGEEQDIFTPAQIASAYAQHQIIHDQHGDIP